MIIDNIEDEAQFVGALFRGGQPRPRTPELIDLVSDEEEEVVEKVFYDSDETCVSDSESVRSVFHFLNRVSKYKITFFVLFHKSVDLIHAKSQKISGSKGGFKVGTTTEYGGGSSSSEELLKWYSITE